MKQFLRCVCTGSVVFALIVGCGGDPSAPTLAPATGTVTYKGGALAGATVTFLPDAGPLAIGATNLKGEFTLKSGTFDGCTVGPVKVAISIGGDDNATPSPGMLNPSAAKSPAEMDAASKKMAEGTMAYQQAASSKPKSLIPARYKDAATSGLSFTVDRDGAKNNFKIELQD